MSLEIIYFLIWILFWVFFWILIWKIIRYSILKDERKKSIKKSKAVILWEVYEKILPFLPDFAYKPRDMVFVWKWVDYIIFDWLNDWKLEKIVFLELKTWASKLNQNEKNIKQVINAKKIEYIEYKINT